jgi:hypothetical protein
MATSRAEMREIGSQRSKYSAAKCDIDNNKNFLLKYQQALCLYRMEPDRQRSLSMAGK